MLVDDDRTLANLIKTLLELDGFAPCVVSQGNQVIPEITSQQPDAVVMDVHLHDRHGLDVLRDIRATYGMETLPVIMASGMDVEDQCMAAGASAFILKPFPPDQLIEVINKHLPSN
jgi:two-component system, OmpR family, response regulator BaeR